MGVRVNPSPRRAVVIPRLAQRAEGPHLRAADHTTYWSVIHSPCVRSLGVFAASGRHDAGRTLVRSADRLSITRRVLELHHVLGIRHLQDKDPAFAERIR